MSAARAAREGGVMGEMRRLPFGNSLWVREDYYARLQARNDALRAALAGVVGESDSALRQIDMATGGFDDCEAFEFIGKIARAALLADAGGEEA